MIEVTSRVAIFYDCRLHAARTGRISIC
jgi:hypothetical protein